MEIKACRKDFIDKGGGQEMSVRGTGNDVKRHDVWGVNGPKMWHVHSKSKKERRCGNPGKHNGKSVQSGCLYFSTENTLTNMADMNNAPFTPCRC